MRRIVCVAVLVLALGACGDDGEATSTTVSETEAIIDRNAERIAEETDCDQLRSDLEQNQEYLDEQAADPDYGMTERQVETREATVAAAEDRLGELGC